MSRVCWGEPITALGAKQLTTEHASDTHEPGSEKTQSSGFRDAEAGAARTNVPDALVELVGDRVDRLGRRSGYCTTVICARDRTTQSVDQIFGARRAGQGPVNRTDEAAAKQCPLGNSIAAVACHDKRRARA